MMSLRYRQAVCLVFALSSLVFPLLGKQKQAQKESAPYFILPTWDGKIVKSTSLKDQVILMVFFQTWCPDCQRMSPHLEKIYQKYKAQRFVVLGVSHDVEKVKAIAPYIKKYSLTYPILLGDTSIAINYLNVTARSPNFTIPYLVLVNRNGNIVGRFVQGRNKETTDIQLLEEQILSLL